MDLLLGFNAVEAALKSGRRTVERVWIEKGHDRGRVVQLKATARSHGVPVEEVDRVRIERLTGGQPRSAHQGVVASAAALPYADPEDLLDACGPEAVLMVLDGVEDPRNFGALLRTAAAVGVSAVFIPERHSAGLSATAARAAAGAAELIPVGRLGNVTAFLKLLKERGFWTVGLEASGALPWDRFEYPSRWALVVGGEGQGLRRLVRETCDQLVHIPLMGGLESLNVSVAAGICLYEAFRQSRVAGRGQEGGGGGIAPP
ncbi:MAG TPA: 23S rRNA (guanosine(2251)-2'-O)-methyltransferase RlmB [Candidatus Polarisedimenticolia bacterium]|jgi:23S rRNA (guanosine2251-2'-O)-methyltransferase